MSQPLDQRESFLIQACGNDQSLIDEVRSLLESFEPAQQVLDVSPVLSADLPKDAVDRIEVPGYEIIKEISRGGQGVIYHAIQLSTKQEVALKFMLEGPFASEASRRRFEREVELVGSLRHPGIVPIYDSGLTSGKYYYAMQYISGVQLQEFVKQRDLNIKDILRLMIDICNAVNYAHQRGVIHRDLKPSNILVDAEGQIHVVDFGLAKREDLTPSNMSTISMSGQIMGSLAYMSPEQASGQPHQVDVRSDVYALGVILYHLLTDELPFDADLTLVENLTAIQQSEPTDLRFHNKAVDHEVNTITLKSMSKEKERRYQTAGALGEDIERYLDGQPIAAKRDSAIYIISKTLNRYRTAVLVAASFLGLVLISSVAAWVLYAAAEKARRQELVTSNELRDERDKAQTLRERARRQLYFAEMNLAGLAANLPGGNQRVEALMSKWDPARTGNDYRGWEWYYLNSHCNRELSLFETQAAVDDCRWSPDEQSIAVANQNHVQIFNVATGEITHSLIGHQRRVFDAVWDSDGSRLATASSDGSVRVWNVANQKETHRFEHSEQFLSVQWHPSNNWLVAGTRDGFLQIWDLNEVKDTLRWPAAGGIATVAWHPVEPILATGSVLGHLQIWDLSPDKPAEIFAAQYKLRVSCLAFSPDGRSLALVTHDGRTQLLDAKSHELIWEKESDGVLQSVSFSPDGKQIATASEDRSIRIRSVTDGRFVRGVYGHRGPVNTVSFRPSGHQIASGSKDRTIRIWTAIPKSENREFRQFAAGEVLFLDWSHDGKRIAACGRKSNIQILDASSGETIRNLTGHSRQVESLRWSHDSNKLVSVSWDQTAIVWDPTTGNQLRKFEGHRTDRNNKKTDAVIHAACWSPDGSRIVTGGHSPRIFVWDSNTMKIVATFADHEGIVSSVDWHPEQDIVVSASHDQTVKVWNSVSGHIIGTAQMEDSICQDVRFSPHGDSFATGSNDGTAVIWDMEEFEPAHVFKGHFGAVRAVRWRPDGSRLATCSEDGTIKIWSTQCATEIMTIEVSEHHVRSIDWSPDGTKLISVDTEGNTRIWDASKGYQERVGR